MMSQTSKRELVAALRPLYTSGNRTIKRQALDELVTATGYHRKYAIQLLNQSPPARVQYDGRVQAALAVI